MKTLISTITFLLASIQINAFAAGSNISLLPQLGTTSFNVTKSGLSAKTGFLAGASVQYQTSIDSVSLETGLQYMQAGAKDDVLIAKVDYTLNYLAIPLLANWTFYKPSDSAKLYFKTGAIFTQLLSAEQKYEDIFGTSSKTNIKDMTAKNDTLLTVGLGGQWRAFDQMNISVDLSWAQGTAKTIKGSNGRSEGLILASSLIFPL